MIIKDFTIFKKSILKIKFDGLYDNFVLFNKFCFLKIEHDRHFWNEWN